MIPAILHQTWETLDPPARFKAFRDGIRRVNPGLDMRLYDEAGRRALIERHWPEALRTYDRLPFGVAKADLFRLIAVHAEGGFYADLDMECVRPIEPFRHTTRAVFSIETEVTPQRQLELGYARPFQIANCMFGAPAGHPFIAELVSATLRRLAAAPLRRADAIEDMTGPRALTRHFYWRRPGDVAILAQVHWLPPDLYAAIPALARHIHFRHHCAGSWKDRDRRPLPLVRRWIERNLLPNPYPRGLWHDFGWR